MGGLPFESKSESESDLGSESESGSESMGDEEWVCVWSGGRVNAFTNTAVEINPSYMKCTPDSASCETKAVHGSVLHLKSVKGVGWMAR